MNKIKKISRLCAIGLCALLMQQCYKETDFEPSKISLSDTAFQLLVSKQGIDADSVSTVIITPELPYNADSSKSSVLLRTDLGTFVESSSQTITLNLRNFPDSAKKLATATLRAGTSSGTAHVQATFYSQTRSASIAFATSYPDILYLTASTLSVKPQTGAAGEATFAAKIYRTSGAPSQRNKVNLTVKDSNYHSIGAFRVFNDLSDATGSTQYIYVLGDSTLNGNNYYGKLYAIASVIKDNSGAFIRDTLTLISTH